MGTLTDYPRRVLFAERESCRGGRVAAGHAAPRPRLALPAGAEDGGGAQQTDATISKRCEERNLDRDGEKTCPRLRGLVYEPSLRGL